MIKLVLLKLFHKLDCVLVLRFKSACFNWSTMWSMYLGLHTQWNAILVLVFRCSVRDFVADWLPINITISFLNKYLFTYLYLLLTFALLLSRILEVIFVSVIFNVNSCSETWYLFRAISRYLVDFCRMIYQSYRISWISIIRIS